jgi:hypothetical protein
LLILVTLVARLYQLQLALDEADRFRDSTRARMTRFPGASDARRGLRQ